MHSYDPFEALIAPARPSKSLARLLMGVVLLVVVFVVTNVAYFGVIQRMPDAAMLFSEINSGTTARGMAWLLGSFTCLLAALGVALHFVHRRTLRSLVGSGVSAFGQARRVIFLCVGIYAVAYLLPMPVDFAAERAMDLDVWLRLLPMSVGLIILQCSAEELVFRGYLQSQLAARFRSPAVWMLFPSVLFGALHYDVTTYGDMAIWIALWSTVFGLVAADITARAGTLGPAIALHVMNNFGALSITAMEGYWDGLALYTLPFGPQDTDALAFMMPLEGGMLLCVWLAARIALRR